MQSSRSTLRSWVRRQVALSRPSLRARLVYTLSCVVLVLLALAAAEHLDDRARRQDLLRGEQLHAAVDAAAAFSAMLDQQFRIAETAGTISLAGRLVPGQIEPFLEEIRARRPDISAIHLTTREDQHFSTSPLEAAGFFEHGEGWPGLPGGVPRLVSELPVDPASGERRVRLSAALQDSSHQPAAIIGLDLDAGGIAGLVPMPAASQRYLLLDARGRPPSGSMPSLDPELARDLARAAAEARGGRRPVPLANLAGAVAPIRDPATGWALVYLQPGGGMPEVAGDDLRWPIFLISMLGLALVLAVVVVVRAGLRPVAALSAATRVVGSGDLSLRLPPAEVEEFDPLVDAFNRMAARLEAARAELLEANRELEARVRERTRALEAEHEKLRGAERLSTLGLLSSAIAHDLRNPLNVVSLSVQWLRLVLDPRDLKVQQRLETMERELRRSERIINTLLAFARTGEPDRAPTDVNELVREVVEVVDPPRGVDIGAELDGHLPPVSLDRAQMFQVLENLARNAVQAMPEGGAVCISTHYREDRLLLCVSDNGPGIPPEIQSSVFEPLVTTKTTGTGLGLALCKRVVDAHRGRIWLTSRLGEGAAFWIELPVGTTPWRQP